MTLYRLRRYFNLFALIFVLFIASRLYGQSKGRSKVAASEDVMVQGIASTYYAKKYHVDLNEAERRLAIQDRAAGIDEEIAKVLGDQYSGIWYDPEDGGKLKIGVTPAARNKTDEVRRFATSFGVSADMDVVTVRFTLAELEKTQNLIRKNIEDMIKAGDARTSYNTKVNKVVVTALSKLPPREEERVKRLTSTDGVTVRRVDQPTLRGKLLACNVTYCNPPFRGGREIAVSSGGACTSAFMARDRTNPNLMWSMTAGHCVFFSGASWMAKDEANNWGIVGNTAYYDFAGGPGRDAGKISIDSGAAWATPAPLPAVVVKASVTDGIATTYDPNYAIRATSWSSIGQILCRTGRSTGTECGEVCDLGADEDATGPDGNTYTLHNMGSLDMCGAQPGDSGGPVYKGHRAYGIFSAVTTGTFSCYESYQGIRGAESAMNVTVILAG